MMETYSELSSWIRTFTTRDMKGNEVKLDSFIEEYQEIGNREQQREYALLLSDAFYKQAEACANSLLIFESLNCVSRCRLLVDDFPNEEHLALQLLQMIIGLVFVKLQVREDGMVDEYMDEVLKIAEDFPKSPGIQRQTAMCMGNLIALCGGFDAPLSYAYDGAERMQVVAERFPNDYELQNIYAHILVSVCYFADQTDNQPRLQAFGSRLRKVQSEEVANDLELRRHLAQVGLSL